MFSIDKYAYQNRWRLLPTVYKVGIYLGMLVLAFSEILPLQLALLVVILPLTCYVARISWKTYLSCYKHPTIFIAISLLTFLLTYRRNTEQLLVYLPFFQGYIGIDQSSLQQTILILLRIYCSLAATYFFVLSTPFVQMIQFFKKIHVPVFLLELIVLMYRFIFLVLHEFITIRDTLDLKFAFYHKKKVYRGWGMLANTLFLKLLDDNERLNEVLSLKFGLEQEGDRGD